VNRAAVAKLVSAVSRLGAAAGPRLRECDLNPVLAGPEHATAVDWLLVLGAVSGGTEGRQCASR